MAGLRQHNGAVDVVAAAPLEKDVPVYIAGFHGFTLDRAETGEGLAIDVSGAVWEFAIPSAVAAPLGTTLYITTDGNHTISATAGTGKVPFAKVTVAKDANNVVWAKQLPQVA
jgi:hypothetical protein